MVTLFVSGAVACCLMVITALVWIAPSWPRLMVAVVAVVLGAAPFVSGWAVLRRGLAAGLEGAVRIGAMLVGMALVAVLVAATDLWTSISAEQPGRLWLSGLTVAMIPMVWVLLYVAPALLLLHFPNGRPPSRCWAWVSVCLLGSIPLLFAAAALMPGPHDPPFEWVAPSPLALPPQWETFAWVLLSIGLMSLLAGLAGAAMSLIFRRRKVTDPTEYAQLRWLGISAFGLPLTLLLCWASYLFLGGPHLAVFGVLALWLSIPVSVWIGFLHRDLFDLDRFAAVGRTVTLVGASALTVSTLVAVGVASLVGRNDPIGVAILTAGFLVALAPLRRRGERWLEQRLAPARVAARDCLDRLLAQVQDGEAKPEALEDRLGEVLQDLCQPGERLRIGYVISGRDEVWDRWGSPIELDKDALGIRLGAHPVAWISGLLVQGTLVLVDLERRIAVVAELVRLRVEVAVVLREGEQERNRLEENALRERRRMELDLHDGTQQRLVALGLNLRVAQRGLSEGDAAISDILDAAVTQLGTAVAELRQLARGLRPAWLDDGLELALAPLAELGPVPVKIRVAVTAVPDALAATAYYIVLEAVTNALKHAQPSCVEVAVEQVDAHLAVRVADDGRGGANAAGPGWSGLVERVAALGGRLDLASPSGGGTTLEVLLPCTTS